MSQHRAKKRFGQNFLHDQGVINGIVAAIRPREGEHLVEIGPGMGAMTEPLLDACKAMDAVELDRDLLPGLRAQFAVQGGLTLHNASLTLVANDKSIIDQHVERISHGWPGQVVRRAEFILGRQEVPLLVGSVLDQLPELLVQFSVLWHSFHCHCRFVKSIIFSCKDMYCMANDKMLCMI